MKRFLGLLMLMFSLVFFSGSSWATSDTDDLRKMLEELRKEVQELKRENAELRSQVEQLKKAPAQAAIPAKGASFMSKGAYGSTPSGINFYGFFKIDAVWQDSSAVGDEYVLWVLPGKIGDGDNKSTINFRHSRFGFDFSKPHKNFRVFGKMEMDFYTESHGEKYLPWNPNHSPVRARRVFAGIEWGTWQLLAGLDWLTISQLYPHLSNFPSGTFMGNPGYRMPQIRLTKWFDTDLGRFKFQIAAEKSYAFPKDDEIIWDEDPANDAGFPGIEWRIAWENKTLLGKPMMLAVWGHYSKEEYDISHGEEDAESYSIGLEAKIPLPIARKAFLLGEAWYGRNFDGYYSCGVAQGTRFLLKDGRYVTRLDRVNNADVVSVDEIDAWGGYVELEVFWTPKFVTHFGWGIDNPDNDDLKGVPAARLQQQMYYANFLYRMTKEFGFGLEYMYIETDYHKELGDGELNRIAGSLYYFF